MKDKLLEIKKYYLELIPFLKSEMDSNQIIKINKIYDSLDIIDVLVISDERDGNFQEGLSRLKSLYESMNHPRVGLSDFFIWKDDYSERVKANQPLDEIKEKLKSAFSNL